MKRFAILFFCFLGMNICANAQTYTQHLQQQQTGKGKVTVSQSQEIDNLVNGVAQDNKTVNKPANRPVAPVNKPTNNNNVKQKDKTVPSVGQTVRGDSSAKEKAAAERAAAERAAAERIAAEKAAAEKAIAEKRAAEKAQEEEEEETRPVIDMRKKVMRGSKKVTGYRVQAFAGGNTRADRNKAQQIGNAIKMRFPDQPIYVHFYSPRWICRVGNYRSYGEASRMLKAVRSMGYKSATIVKGKITVFE